MTGSLEEAIGHRFDDRALLAAALTHRSYAGDDPDADDYERLEFLGDAVLQLAITDRIFADYDEMPEGQLAKLRATVVNEETLSALATRLGVGAHLRLGKGEEVTGGREKPSILADVMEALFGALYLDAGYRKAREVILELLGADVDARSRAPGVEDFKTRLQEALARAGGRWEYRVTDEGPDHDKVFTAEVWLEDQRLGWGTGGSKKAAEQAAARQALDAL